MRGATRVGPTLAAALLVLALAAAVLVLALAAPAGAFLDDGAGHPTLRQEPRVREAVVWRDSVPIGSTSGGRLVRGVRLPGDAREYFTWDPLLHRRPNRANRRHGTDELVRVLLRVVRAYARDHPDAPRVGIGDLSRPRGGWFGPKHVSHQNGLDADVYYPRRDRRLRPPKRADQIDRPLAQDLVDRFVRAGAVRVFVGPGTRLVGPPGVVQYLAGHDNHLHVRIGAMTS